MATVKDKKMASEKVARMFNIPRKSQVKNFKDK